MASAIVTLEVLEVSDLDPSHSAHADAHGPFLFARIGPRDQSRKVLTTNQSTVDLREADWRHVARVEARDRFRLSVELWLENDTLPPTCVASLGTRVDFDPARPGVFEPVFRGQGMTVRVRLTVKSVLAPRATGTRGPTETTTYQLPRTVPNVVVVEITEIVGLFEPHRAETVPTEPRGVDHPELRVTYSRPRTQNFRNEGGRVFLNRDPDGRWLSWNQYIDVTARLSAIRGEIPDGAKIRWSVAVPHDPIKNDPQVRREARAHLLHPYTDGWVSIDPAKGPKWTNNFGMAGPRHCWEAKDDHTVSNVEDESAESVVIGDASRVRLYCPNRIGDRFVLTASLVADESTEVIEDITGLITMWHRLDCEYRPQFGTYNLRPAIERAVPGYWAACIQFDLHYLPAITPPNHAREGALRSTGERRPLGFDPYLHLAYSRESEPETSALYMADPAVFPHSGQPGWFSIAGANLAHPHPMPPELRRGQQEPCLWEGEATLYSIGDNDFLVLEPTVPPGEPPPRNAIRKIRLWWHGDMLTFEVASARERELPDGTRRLAIEVFPQDLTDVFDAANGHTMDHLYSAAVNYGLRDFFPTVSGEPAPRTRMRILNMPLMSVGRAPTIRDHFSGRLILFTWHPTYRNSRAHAWDDARMAEDMPRAILHEFNHSLFAPHKCGAFAYRHDSGGTCAMNYDSHPNRRYGEFIPGTTKRRALELCGLHLSQLREVVLQDSPVLRDDFHW